MKYLNSLCSFLIILLISFSAYSQVDRGGVPRSFNLIGEKDNLLNAINISTPDRSILDQEDRNDSQLEKPYRVGIEIPVSISSENIGTWIKLSDGYLWRVAIKCFGAQALGLNFDNFYLPDGTDVFVYSADHQYVIGAITSNVLSGTRKFAVRPIAGDEVIVEYFRPFDVPEGSPITISGLVFQYRGFEKIVENDKSALGSCEVNVNCSEGLNWKDQKNGVVKIYCKIGSKYFYCSGTLVNNTAQDFAGLLLTASHCNRDLFSGAAATKDDLDQWVFYFNYESSGCTTTSAQEFTVVGAEKLAISDNPDDIGSDFFLLRLRSKIPANYYPYYCGWDAGTGNSSSGVGIHHPNGEIKKISTYTTLLGSSTWGITKDTHWVVKWSKTDNGHGVTEGGSSGSALFDDENLIIGTLTGGESSCQNLTSEDKYGKFSYSWLSNGPTPSQQLKPWLDPLNSGVLKLPGAFNQNQAVANFSANTREIPVGGTVDFTDLSSGKPVKWHWYFQNAEPKESFDQNPSGIRFERYGQMNVKLVVTNAYNADSIIKKEYINVKAVVSPNPSYGDVKILTDINSKSDIQIEVFDLMGKIVQYFEYKAQQTPYYSIKLPANGNAFIIRVIQGDQQQSHKVIVIH